MAKRRKRYGSPPAAHKARAATDARLVRNYAARAVAAAKKGDCSSALTLLVGAARQSGATHAEVRGEENLARQDRRSKVTTRVVQNAAYKFRSACVKPARR
jgi:hypothetical protein